MLEDRGYDVDHLKNYTAEEIKIMLNAHRIGKFESISDIGPLDIYLEKKATDSGKSKDVDVVDSMMKNLTIKADSGKSKDVDAVDSMMKNLTIKADSESIKGKTTGGQGVEKIYIKYRLDSKFKGTTSLHTQITDIFDQHLTTKDTLIILNISRVLMKAGIKDKIDEDFVNKFFIVKNYFIQIFGLENFLFNVCRHDFVPKHRILSKQETQELMTHFNCSVTNIPTIKRDDAQAKYIGLRPKQICEIKVENVSSGVTTRYRHCVN